MSKVQIELTEKEVHNILFALQILETQAGSDGSPPNFIEFLKKTRASITCQVRDIISQYTEIYRAGDQKFKVVKEHESGVIGEGDFMIYLWTPPPFPGWKPVGSRKTIVEAEGFINDYKE